MKVSRVQWAPMSIGRACSVFGFRQPPVHRAELKKAFNTLALKYHPDQGGPDASPQRMMDVTEAYAVLKKLIDNGVHASVGRANGATGCGANGAYNDAENMAAEAAAFQAPGSSLSLRSFTLPWQRKATQRVVREHNAQLEQLIDQGSFVEFMGRAREAERKLHRKDAPSGSATGSGGTTAAADGSHGFNSEYFANLDSATSNMRRGTTARRSPMQLAWMYWSRRLITLPRRAIRAVQFIVHGN